MHTRATWARSTGLDWGLRVPYRASPHAQPHAKHDDGAGNYEENDTSLEGSFRSTKAR